MTVRPRRRHALGVALSVLLTAIPVMAVTVAQSEGATAPAETVLSLAADGEPEPAPADIAVPVPAVADPVGAPMQSPAASRHAATVCYGDVTDPARPTVLLVPGTGLTAEENWGPTYRPALRALGFPVCQVDLPHHATRDVQLSVEAVATAIHDVRAASGRDISVVGLSQGAMLPRAALRVWPVLATEIDDMIGLAGVYDSGSASVSERCRKACVPALQQLRQRAALLTALSRRRLPGGVSYTNIGTDADTTVTPQPTANQQRGSRSVLIQEVCPDRDPGEHAHGWLVGDAVAFAITVDALTAKGTGYAPRIPVSTCDQQYYDGFDADTWRSYVDLIGTRLTGTVTREPVVRCYLRPECTDAVARGRLLSRSVPAIHDRALVWTGMATGPGLLRLRYDDQVVVRRVQRPGRVSLRLPAARVVKMCVVETRPANFSAWVQESKHRMRAAS